MADMGSKDGVRQPSKATIVLSYSGWHLSDTDWKEAYAGA